MRLIDADVLENQNICDYCEKNNHCCEYECFNWYEEETIRKMIKQAPTIDAVPVVRCKDCVCRAENKEKGYKYCVFAGWLIKDDDFCSHGERLDEEVQDGTD